MNHGYVPSDGGVRLFFQQEGNGPAAVIIPHALFLYDDFRRLANGRTLIFIDWRNRGRSEPGDALSRGVHNDVDDLDVVRRHFGFERVSIIGHSYSAITAVLYAMKYPAHVERVIQIGAMQPFLGKDYPEHLKCADETFASVMAGLQQLETERASADPVEFCRKFWELLRILFVVNPADAGKLAWDPCASSNERQFRKQFVESVLPSLRDLNLTPEALAGVQAPVLTIHGRKDRSAPYGGGVEWASLLPNARLLTVEGGGHFPWVEEPDTVFGAIDRFLSGA